jgi:mannose-6-phosphate isomerase-like protein (cupin superfamily)
MPKYTFQQEEYQNWMSEGYVDHEWTDHTGRTYKQIGARSHLLAGDSDSPEQFGFASDTSYGVNSFRPGGVYETHSHQTFQFYFVLSGSAKMRVADEERKAEKGAWIAIPPEVDHYLENDGDEPFTYIMIGGNRLP